MTKIVIVIALIILVYPGVSHAADIQGSIIIRHRLTRKRVTANAGAYDRGVNVPLSSEAVVDPLSFERLHVVIYLEGESPEHGSSPAVIEQKSRRFEPDLLVVTMGSSVSFPNLDPIFHNVFSLSKPKSFDLGNYPKGQSRTVTFNTPGVVLVNCRLHTNMTAAIVVTPNSWSARSDADGHFVLRNVPSGKQTVVAWHKSAGFFRKTIVVDDRHDTSISFDIPLDENGVLTPNPSVARR